MTKETITLEAARIHDEGCCFGSDCPFRWLHITAFLNRVSWA